jgi:hypothetical protein
LISGICSSYLLTFGTIILFGIIEEFEFNGASESELLK